MVKDQLNEAIYTRYILPTKRERTKTAGLEFEFPILNEKDEAVDFLKIHQMTDSFIKNFSFTNLSYDDDGHERGKRTPR